MPTLEDIKNRVRQILDDAASDRFSDALLENAIRQALARLDEKLPLIRCVDQQITTSGRNVSLTELVHPLYLIEVCVLPLSAGGCENKIKTGYSYTLQGSSGSLHFSGEYFPSAGETLRVTYAAQNTLTSLDGASETSVPESASAALETGSASFACLLRAVSLAEAYGARTGESARLVEQSKLWKGLSEEALNKLKTFQPFEYPSGFALDPWDR
jgi:hypothetical protein